MIPYLTTIEQNTYFALRLSLDSRFAAFLLHLFNGLQLHVLHERSADRYRRLCKAQCVRMRIVYGYLT